MFLQFAENERQQVRGLVLALLLTHWSLLSQDCRRNQREDQAYGKWFKESDGRVEERIAVHLFELLHLLSLGLDDFGTRAGRTRLADDVRGVLVEEIGHEVEIDNLPRDYVTGGRDDGDQNADNERAAKTDGAAAHVLAIRANAEEHQRERQHHRCVANDQSPCLESDFVVERESREHERGHQRAGDQTEGDYDLFHLVNLSKLCLVERRELSREEKLLSSYFRVI